MSDERLPASDEPQEISPASSTENNPAPGASDPTPSAAKPLDLPREYGGRKGPDPVRYGDWEKGGRCIDF